MYLMDSSAPAVNNRKWNLGRFRSMGRLGLSPVRLPNLGASSSTDQNWRMGRLRGLGRLGDTTLISNPSGDVYQDPSSGWIIDNSGPTTVIYDANGNVVSPNNMPSPVGRQNPSPIAGGASNGGITTVPAMTPSNNPLDYTSPQAAIAAGLDANTTMAAWTKALARFPSPQAAISAGIPAGVVNQLWQQSNVNAANAAAASASSSADFGSLALYGAGGLLLLMALSGGKGRR